MQSYNYSGSFWNYVLPDGNAFCHWGGRDISYKVLELLDLKEKDRLCDICCGGAGTLALITHPLAEVYGIDISPRALETASRNLKDKGYHLRQGDVREMPFVDSCFTKLFAQDPDVFLYPNKQRTMDEISRITREGGRFVLQTYCVTSYLREDKEKTEEVLRRNGYVYADVVSLEELKRLVKQSGFVVQDLQDLHDIYSQDNLRMIKNLEERWEFIRQSDEQQAKNLRELLYWERHLFSEKAWTGVLLVMEKQ